MFTQKFKIVADQTVGLSGKLVDIGARDRVLLKYLAEARLQYLSADIVPGHDFNWNLEYPIPVADCAFEVVVALDVLEHLENFHDTLREVIRISSSKVFVSLPNMACLSHRWTFLRQGRLSAKYDLDSIHPGDRHRWLTTYAQANDTVTTIARELGCTVDRHDVLETPSSLGAAYWVTRLLPLGPGLRTYTMVYEITKPH